MATYKEKLEEQLEILEKKLQKAEAAEKFDKTPQGQIIVDFLSESINSGFKQMTSDTPLEREEYIKLHAQMALLRRLNVAIFAPSRQKDTVKREIEDVQSKLRTE